MSADAHGASAIRVVAVVAAVAAVVVVVVVGVVGIAVVAAVAVVAPYLCSQHPAPASIAQKGYLSNSVSQSHQNCSSTLQCLLPTPLYPPLQCRCTSALRYK